MLSSTLRVRGKGQNNLQSFVYSLWICASWSGGGALLYSRHSGRLKARSVFATTLSIMVNRLMLPRNLLSGYAPPRSECTPGVQICSKLSVLEGSFIPVHIMGLKKLLVSSIANSCNACLMFGSKLRLPSLNF